MKIVSIVFAMTCLAAIYNCATFSTRSKSKKLMMAEDVLDSLKNFNNKYSGLKGNFILFLFNFYFIIYFIQ